MKIAAHTMANISVVCLSVCLVRCQLYTRIFHRKSLTYQQKVFYSNTFKRRA